MRQNKFDISLEILSHSYNTEKFSACNLLRFFFNSILQIHLNDKHLLCQQHEIWTFLLTPPLF